VCPVLFGYAECAEVLCLPILNLLRLIFVKCQYLFAQSYILKYLNAILSYCPGVSITIFIVVIAVYVLYFVLNLIFPEDDLRL
jgi:hypothetical protein